MTAAVNRAGPVRGLMNRRVRDLRDCRHAF
jgi:hypothetical protein